jgi:hypothetical protein
VLGTFSARLAFSDIDVKTIGLFSYLALPYSLKFLWSPVVDKLDVPILSRLLGRRRAVDGAVAALRRRVADSDGLRRHREPARASRPRRFMVAFFAATQDVVIDGWRIDAVGTEMQGIMAATSNLGYRLALITAGAGALFLADWRGLDDRLSHHGGLDERRHPRRARRAGARAQASGGVDRARGSPVAGGPARWRTGPSSSPSRTCTGASDRVSGPSS